MPPLSVDRRTPAVAAVSTGAILPGPVAAVVAVLPHVHRLLKTPLAPVDTDHMTHPDLELFDANPEWRPLLAAYHERHAIQKLEWSPRVAEVPGLAAEQLSGIHGKLIALGMLKFEIASRADGVQYQVTTLGRQALLPAESRQIVPEWMQTEESEASAA
jgi:hypothetical protein